MKIGKLNREFGLDATNNLAYVHQSSIGGAIAGLESFYYSFNNKDLDALQKVWYHHEFIQLNNPIGGIVRGSAPILQLYEQIFHGPASVWVRFTDIVFYATEDMVVFAGTEVGEFTTNGETIPLQFRTSRIFCYVDNEKRWFQLHHHGSIDNADLLSRYQAAIKK
jgi:hypothetical protein